MASGSGDPFEGQHIDANMLGGRPDAPTPCQHCLVASGRPLSSGHIQGNSQSGTTTACSWMGRGNRRRVR